MVCIIWVYGEEGVGFVFGVYGVVCLVWWDVVNGVWEYVELFSVFVVEY